MAQLRQRQGEIEAVGGAVYCVVPGDDSRAMFFKERSAGPFCTLSDPAGRTGAMYGVTKLHTGVDWATYDNQGNVVKVTMMKPKGKAARAKSSKRKT